MVHPIRLQPVRTIRGVSFWGMCRKVKNAGGGRVMANGANPASPHSAHAEPVEALSLSFVPCAQPHEEKAILRQAQDERGWGSATPIPPPFALRRP